jgi:hypothetical protein
VISDSNKVEMGSQFLGKLLQAIVSTESRAIVSRCIGALTCCPVFAVRGNEDEARLGENGRYAREGD